MSPLQFQKQIRLQEAQRRLLSITVDVASVGFDVGYESPSQFSREYRRLFGAPPGRDMARQRRDFKTNGAMGRGERRWQEPVEAEGPSQRKTY